MAIAEAVRGSRPSAPGNSSRREAKSTAQPREKAARGAPREKKERKREPEKAHAQIATVVPSPMPMPTAALFGQASDWVQQMSRGAAASGKSSEAGPPSSKSTGEVPAAKQAPTRNPFLAAKVIRTFPDGGQVVATYTDKLSDDKDESSKEQLKNIRGFMDGLRYYENRPWTTNFESPSYKKSLTFVSIDSKGLTHGVAIVFPDRNTFHIRYLAGSNRGVWRLYESIAHQAASKGRRARVSADHDDFPKLKQGEEAVIRARIDRAAHLYGPYSVGSSKARAISEEEMDKLLIERDEAFSTYSPTKIASMRAELDAMSEVDPQRASIISLIAHIWESHENRLTHERFLAALKVNEMKLEKGKVVQQGGGEPTQKQLTGMTRLLKRLAKKTNFYQELEELLPPEKLQPNSKKGPTSKAKQ